MTQTGNDGTEGPILITGGTGFVGHCIADRLGPRAIPVSHRALDIFIEPAVERALDRWRPAAVINAAAWADVERCERDPEGARRVNALGPEILAKVCSRHGVALVHISTDYVFGMHGHDIYHADTPPDPVNVYGKTKAEGEARVLDRFPGAAVARTAWVYGTTGRGFGLRAARGLLAHRVLFAIMDRFGHPTWVEDLAQHLISLAALRLGGIHHVVNGGPTSWYEFSLRLARRLGVPDTRIAGVSASALPSWLAPRPRRVHLAPTDHVAGPLDLPPPRTWKAAQDAFLKTFLDARVTPRRPGRNSDPRCAAEPREAEMTPATRGSGQRPDPHP